MDSNALATITHLVTLSAIILGGGWTIWKWVFEEARRRKREITSLDGHLRATATPLDKRRVLITIEAIWRNPGALPVRVDTNNVKIAVYELDKNASLGELDTHSNLKPFKYRSLPLSHRTEYILEPNTESIMQDHFVLGTEEVYLIRWEIYERPIRPGAIAGLWSRDLIWRYMDSELSKNSIKLPTKAT